MLNVRPKSSENLIQSFYNSAQGVLLWGIGGLAVAGAGTMLALGVLENRYGYEKVGPWMLVNCGGGLFAIGALVIGGRVFWRWYQTLESDVTPRQMAYANEEDDGYGAQGTVNSRWVNYMLAAYSLRRTDYGLGLGIDTKTGVYKEVQFHRGDNAHLSIVGKTGKGKSMAALRPLILEAAITGLYQIVVLDMSGKDFTMFEGFPNVHVIRYNEDTITGTMEKISDYVATREKKVLMKHKVGSIDDIPLKTRPPRVLLIFDEYSNAYQLMNVKKVDTTPLNGSTMIVAQRGRASGIHLVLAMQRADANSINTTIRSSLQTLAFGVRDATDSKMAGVEGAENLETGHTLLTQSNGVFELKMHYPTPTEINAVLDARREDLIKKDKDSGPNGRRYIHSDISWLGEYQHGLPDESDIPIHPASLLPSPQAVLGGTAVNGFGGAGGGDLVNSAGDSPWIEMGDEPGAIAPVPAKTHAPAVAIAPNPAPALPLPVNVDARQQMLDILAQDDGTRHPSLNIPLAYVKAHQAGVVGGLDQETMNGIIQQHIQAVEWLMTSLGKIDATEPISTQVTPSTTAKKTFLTEDEKREATHAKMREMIEYDTKELMFSPSDDVADVLRKVTKAEYEAGAMGLQAKDGITTVAKIIFPKVSNPNNNHKEVVRQIRDNEGIPKLGPTGDFIVDSD